LHDIASDPRGDHGRFDRLRASIAGFGDFHKFRAAAARRPELWSLPDELRRAARLLRFEEQLPGDAEKLDQMADQIDPQTI
jgi:hypothetical protein